jgi:hypothetical protein
VSPGELDPYEVLGPFGITPDASMENIQRHFDRSLPERRAKEALAMVRKRLKADLFLYPLWAYEEKDKGHGS